MTSRPDSTEGGVSSEGHGSSLRPLNIDFDMYTEGDREYKKELCLAITDNIIELRRSLTDSIQQNNPGLFLEVCHKATLTINMLADREFSGIIEELKRDIGHADKGRLRAPRLSHFHEVCDLIIISVRKELNGLEN